MLTSNNKVLLTTIVLVGVLVILSRPSCYFTWVGLLCPAVLLRLTGSPQSSGLKPQVPSGRQFWQDISDIIRFYFLTHIQIYSF